MVPPAISRAALFLPIASFLVGCVTVENPQGATPLPSESKFVRFEIPIQGGHSETYPGWRTRSAGKPVLLFHAVNGISSEVLEFALEMETWGYRVYIPSLYGDPIGRDSAFGYDKEFSSIKILKQSGAWNPVSTDTAGPIVDDAAAMARWVFRREGGRSLIVIGNSLTGAFPLALLSQPEVRVAVLGQPAMPAKRMHQVVMRLPLDEETGRSLALSESDWSAVTRAVSRDCRKKIIGFHYWNDPMGSIDRFDAVHERLKSAGVSSRFRAYVKVPPGNSYADDRAWVTGSETSEKKGMVTPHPTYIDAQNEEDLEWFRNRLRESLAKN